MTRNHMHETLNSIMYVKGFHVNKLKGQAECRAQSTLDRSLADEKLSESGSWR